MKSTVFVLCAGLLLVVGCTKQDSGSETQSESATTAEQAQNLKDSAAEAAATMAPAGITQATGDTITTESGLMYIDIKVGDGDPPQPGQLIAAHYTGWLTDGTKFDSSRDRGEPLRFPIGQGRVIKGWDEGLISMKPGGRRLLIIPPGLGYGDRGTPGGPIPPGATLIFDVELVEIQAAPQTP